ncbi:MAG TPA: hypothetical protein VE177_01405, partial [Candidatus Binatus sp.]|nr:hypothetical protein [Candidatus Binatus sp.]
IFYIARQKGTNVGLARDNLLRVSIYFICLVIFDAIRNFDKGLILWTAYGTVFSLGLIILAFGHVAAVLNYCPDVRTLRASIVRLVRPSIPNAIYCAFSLIGLTWMTGSIIALDHLPLAQPTSQSWLGGLSTPPPWYANFAIALMVPLIAYPGVLLLVAIRRTKAANVKYSLAMLLAGWLSLSTSQLILLVQVSDSLLSSQAGILASSLFFVLCSFAVRYKSGMIHVLTSQLSPQPVLKNGQRYLVLHDGGKEIVSFLTASLQSIVEAGGRIVLNSTGQGSIIPTLTKGSPKFDGWVKAGRIVGSKELPSFRESLSERLTTGPTQVTYLTELGQDDLQNSNFSHDQENRLSENQNASQLYLLESSKAPRLLLSEFLKNNREVEVLNLSETKDTFSSLIGLDHQRVQGLKILLDYDSSINYEDIVIRFFAESTSNAEVCALFTSKSSKLYRTPKGNKMIKVIAASSIVSTMSEHPNGEVEIPDRELGLVAAITSELLENETMNCSIVYDSIQELMISEHWEQTYSGIKQLFELVSVPNSTVIMLCNRETMDPRLLNAIRSFFSVQLRLDSTGLHTVKLSLI